MIKNYKMILSYDGGRYDGWQKQGNTGNTVQGKLEDILLKLMGEPIPVTGSGRTDAGVHALAQVANFHGELDCDAEEVKAYFNRYLPEDIGVASVEIVDDKFHSRLSPSEKTYLYKIEMAPKKAVFERKYCYGLGKRLSVKAMREAAAYLLGEHDFKSFCSNKKMKKSSVRCITAITMETEGTKLLIRYTGDGFLQHMVRIMTGTLIQVGLRERSPQEIEEILKKEDRQAAGFTAPAEGLFLESVRYKDRERND